MSPIIWVARDLSLAAALAVLLDLAAGSALLQILQEWGAGRADERTGALQRFPLCWCAAALQRLLPAAAGARCSLLLALVLPVTFGLCREADRVRRKKSSSSKDGELASKHFAKVTLRSYNSILESNVIPRVISGDESRNGIAKPRYLKAAMFCLGCVLNSLTIVGNWYRHRPVEQTMVTRMLDGSHAGDTSSCLWEKAWDESRVPDGPCLRIEGDQQALILSFLYTSELVCLGSVLALCAWHLSALRWSLQASGLECDSSPWRSVVAGLDWLEYYSTFSSMKALPRVKQLPGEALSRLKLKMQELTEDDGEFSAFDKVHAATFLVADLFLHLLIAFAGLLALFLKMDSLTWLFQVPIQRWSRGRLFTFIGFANQLAGLVPLDLVRKENFFFFLFTGEDAQMQVDEENAMLDFKGCILKHIFHIYGLRKGFVAAVTISPHDLQKFVVVEKSGNEE